MVREEPLLAVDIGTGSGCIAIALVKNNPFVTVIATDISYPALKTAHKNALQHGVIDQVRLIQADLIPPISDQFDLMCANLPYIPTQTLQKLEISGREPNLALDGGRNGLDFISRLIKEAQECLAPGGFLLIEIDSSQREQLRDLAEGAFPHAEIEVLPDLSGRDRLIAIHPLEKK